MVSPPSDLPTTRDEEAERPSLTDAAPGLIVVGTMLAIMWGTEIIDLLPRVDLDGWGIRPRSVRGLFGIIFAPFLHVGFGHLIGNTIPFALLGGVIALTGTRQFTEVTITIGLVSGLGVWLFARSGSVHLGASGLVFGFITYLLARGFFAARIMWIVGGLAVGMIYGSTLMWGLLPTGRFSWLGHLFGAIGGIAAAYLLHAADKEPDEDE